MLTPYLLPINQLYFIADTILECYSMNIILISLTYIPIYIFSIEKLMVIIIDTLLESLLNLLYVFHELNHLVSPTIV